MKQLVLANGFVLVVPDLTQAGVVAGAYQALGAPYTDTWSLSDPVVVGSNFYAYGGMFGQPANQYGGVYVAVAAITDVPSGSNPNVPIFTSGQAGGGVNCLVPNCNVSLQVVPSTVFNPEIVQAEMLIFGAAFLAAVTIWGARRLLGIFNTGERE